MIRLDSKPTHGRYTLRPVTDDDFDFLWRLRVQTLKPHIEKLFGWDEQGAKQILLRMMPDSHLVLVGGESAGVLKVTEQDGYVVLNEIGLMPNRQNKGLGTRIIKDVISLADGLGMPVELQVFSINPAVKLYEKLGFQTTHYKMMRKAGARTNR